MIPSENMYKRNSYTTLVVMGMKWNEFRTGNNKNITKIRNSLIKICTLS